MEEEKIKKEMKKLAEKIQYEFNNINWLSKAMNCETPKSSEIKYKNQPLSTLGDTILKFTLTEYFYNKGKNQKEITEEKIETEKNETLSKLRDDLKIYNYAYNDKYFFSEAPKNKQLPKPKHDIFIEAIIAAIYKDRGIRYCKKWIIKIWRENGLL